MKPFNNQFATQRLRDSFNEVKFTIDDSNLYDDVIKNYGENITIKKDYLVSDPETYEKIQDLVNSLGKAGELNDYSEPSDYMKHREDPKSYEKEFQKAGTSDYFQRRGVEEQGSVTGGEAYLPGLDVPEKKYKGPTKESKLDKPYNKVKGFRPGHTEDTGGFQYDDLWDLNENYSRFKKETKTRTNEQQLHAAMRLAEKKIHEANRILEYTAQLRTELTETKVTKNTQKLMEKITRGIAEAYGKMKKLK